MMTLDELFKEFEGKTSLQRDETRKKLVGQEIQIVGELGVIAPEYLGCRSLKPKHSYLSSLHITHAGAHLREQLLEYASGDIVRMNTRFTGVVSSEYDRWSFALVSLVRLKTHDARVNERAADARRAEADEGRAAMFGFYFLYLLPILTYGTLLAPAFSGSPKRNWEIWDLLLLVVLIPGWNWLMCLLPLMFDDPAERQLFYKIFIGWAIAGGVVFVAVALGSWVLRPSADVLGEAERR